MDGSLINKIRKKHVKNKMIFDEDVQHMFWTGGAKMSFVFGSLIIVHGLMSAIMLESDWSDQSNASVSPFCQSHQVEVVPSQSRADTSAVDLDTSEHASMRKALTATIA
jgi:hypothetical protein